MSEGPRSTALFLALASLGLGAVLGIGCGDESNTDVTLPTISVGSTETAAPTETGATTTQPTPTTSQNGGTGAVDPNAPDSQSNDKAPEPGSPEEAFENACKQNPAACG